MKIYSPISSIMTPNPITVHPKDKLSYIKELLDKKNIHHLPVIQEGELVGMLSKSDLLLMQKKQFNQYDDILEKSRLNAFHVEDIMTTGLAKVAPNDSIAAVLKVFQRNLFHAVLVMEKDKLVGIVTTFDIINQLIEEVEGKLDNNHVSL